MIRYLFGRLLWSVVVIWVVATSVFVIYFVAPRDVARLIAGARRARTRSGLSVLVSGCDRPPVAHTADFCGGSRREISASPSSRRSA